MKELTVIFPAAAMMLVFILTAETVSASENEELRLSRCFCMDRRDRIAAWAITLLYAATAFLNLGATRAPESAVRPERGELISVYFPEGTRISRIRWYAYGTVGKWNVAFSEQGSAWDEITELDQNYVSVFKWNDTTLSASASGNTIGIWAVSGSPMLGELAFYDESGTLVEPIAQRGGDALFDERELVPAQGQSYENSSYFDEIYHARTAWEGLHGESIYEISHPPLGKLILSLGILLFGMTPFGWRFSGTLFGVLMLPILYAFVKRIFGSRRTAALCTIVFAADFMHFAQTRIATIDSYAVFFILLMYYFMYGFLTETEEKSARRSLALCGVSFGLGAASKWTCIYAGAGLAVLWLVYWIRSGELFKKRFWRNVGFCLVFFVAVPALIYYVSYLPYGLAKGLSWPAMLFRREYLCEVLSNQKYMWTYHSGLVATHPYSSRWWQWLLDIRPILYYLQYGEDGTRSAITAFTSPLLCWGGLAAMCLCAYDALMNRDRRAGFIVLGYLAQLLPWVAVTRLTFAYHYFPSELFLVLALGYEFDELEHHGGKRWLAPLFAGASVVLFLCFLPVLNGLEVSTRYGELFLKWFGTWPI